MVPLALAQRVPAPVLVLKPLLGSEGFYVKKRVIP
jgi:hypothetical protein